MILSFHECMFISFQVSKSEEAGNPWVESDSYFVAYTDFF